MCYSYLTISDCFQRYTASTADSRQINQNNSTFDYPPNISSGFNRLSTVLPLSYPVNKWSIVLYFCCYLNECDEGRPSHTRHLTTANFSVIGAVGGKTVGILNSVKNCEGGFKCKMKSVKTWPARSSWKSNKQDGLQWVDTSSRYRRETELGKDWDR